MSSIKNKVSIIKRAVLPSEIEIYAQVGFSNTEKSSHTGLPF